LVLLNIKHSKEECIEDGRMDKTGAACIREANSW